MPRRTDRLPALDRVVQRAIEDRGRNLLLQLRGHVPHGFEQPVQMKARLGRSKNHRRVIKKEQMLLHPLSKLGKRRHRRVASFKPLLLFAPLNFLFTRLAHAFFHQIPFVNHDDARLLFLDDFIANLIVLLGNAHLGVEHQHGNIAARNGIFRALHAEELDRFIHTPRFAHPSRINQHVPFAFPVRLHLERHVDGIARCSWNRADDDALRLGKRVNDGRFSDIRSTNDRKLQTMLRRHFRLFAVRKKRYCFRGKRLDAFAMNRGNRKHIIKAQPCKIRRLILHPLRVHLVRSDQNWFARPSQPFRHFLVERHHAFLNVDYKNDSVRGFNRQSHLFDCRLNDRVPLFFPAQQPNAARVHQSKLAPLPFRFAADTIARHARLIVHNRDAPPNHAIEQRRLPDVRPPHNCN